MHIRYPAPPGGLARSLTVKRSPVTGEVIATAGPPLPVGPEAVWTPRSSTVVHGDAAPIAAPVASGRDA